jgi:hypothetical protein
MEEAIDTDAEHGRPIKVRHVLGFRLALNCSKGASHVQVSNARRYSIAKVSSP